VTKRDHEELFLTVGYAYRIPTVALRYFNIYGERQALSNPYTGVAAIFSARVLNGQPPVIFEDGKQSRDFVHVSDVIQANLLAATADNPDALNQLYNVAVAERTTLNELFELERALLVDHFPWVRDSRPHYREFREGDVRHSLADISKARRLLAYAPTHRVGEGLKEAMGWYIENLPRES